MIKLGCNSQQNIVNFIERSGKILQVRAYYINLLIYRYFELSLKKIEEHLKKKHPCFLRDFF